MEEETRVVTAIRLVEDVHPTTLVSGSAIRSNSDHHSNDALVGSRLYGGLGADWKGGSRLPVWSYLVRCWIQHTIQMMYRQLPFFRTGTTERRRVRKSGSDTRHTTCRPRKLYHHHQSVYYCGGLIHLKLRTTSAVVPWMDPISDAFIHTHRRIFRIRNQQREYKISSGKERLLICREPRKSTTSIICFQTIASVGG